MTQIRVQKEIGEYLGLLADGNGSFRAAAKEKVSMNEVVEIVARVEAKFANQILDYKHRINELANELTVKNHTNGTV